MSKYIIQICTNGCAIMVFQNARFPRGVLILITRKKNNRNNEKLNRFSKNLMTRKGIGAFLALFVLLTGVIGYQIYTAYALNISTDLIPQADARLDAGTTWANWVETKTSSWTTAKPDTTSGWYLTTDGFDTGTGAYKTYKPFNKTNLETASIYHTFTVPAGYNSGTDSINASFYYRKQIGTSAVTTSNVKWQIIRNSDSFVMGSGTVNSATAANTSVAWTQVNINLKTITTPVAAGTTYRLLVGHEARTQNLTGSTVQVNFDVARVVHSIPDTQSPVPAWNTPNTDGQYLKGTFNLISDATDNLGVTQVDFQYDTNSGFTAPTTVTGSTLTAGSAANGSWTKSFNSSALNGLYYFRVRASDGSSNLGTSATRTIYIDNTTPSAGTMTAPVDLADVRGLINLTANAQDNLNVQTVNFEWANNTAFTGATTVSGAILTAGTAINGTWTKSSFDTGTMGDGTRYIRAKVTDTAGNVFTGAYITVNVDNTAPTAATITAPSTNASVKGLINLDTNAVDAYYVNSVVFELANNVSFTGATTVSGATLVSGTNQNGTWRKTGFDTAVLTDGDWYIRAKASDKSGNTYTGAYITINVDNTLPTVSAVIAPTNNVDIKGTINLDANAQDAISVNSVDFEYANNMGFTGATTVSGSTLLSGTNQNGTWRKAGFDTTVMADGDWYIRAKATDSAGNTYTGANVTIHVDNTAPSAAAMTLPINGASVKGTINLEANGQDSVYVNSVDFEFADNIGFSGSTIVSGSILVAGTNQNGTWRKTLFDTTGLADGDWYFRARATDKTGNTFTGTYIIIHVDNNAPTFNVYYFSDAGLTSQLPVYALKSYAKTGNVYIKVVPNKSLSSAPTISINAPGTLNTRTNVTAALTGGNYVYNWNVAADTDGDANVTVSGTDQGGNTASNIVPGSGGTVTIDTVKPQVVSAVSVDNTHVDLHFSEALDAAAANAANYTITGGAGLTVSAASLDAGDKSLVHLTTAGQSVITYTVTTDTANIKDLALNTLDPSFNTANFTGQALPPTFTVAFYSDSGLTTPLPTFSGNPVTKLGTVYLKLTASMAMASPPTFSIAAPGSVNNVTNVLTTLVSGNIYKGTWVVSPGAIIDGNATTTVSGTGSNGGIATNAAPTSGGTVTVDTTVNAPNLTSVSASSGSVAINWTTTDQDINQFKLYRSTTSGFVPSDATNLIATVAGGTTTYSDSVTADGTYYYQIKATDIAGNISGSSNEKSVAVILDNTPPSLLEAEPTSKQMLYLTFNEAIQDPNTSGSTISIDGGMAISQVVLTGDPKIVRLVLSSTQGTGNQQTPLSYTVTVQNIKDFANNNLASAAKSFEAFTPHGKYAPDPITQGSDTRMCGQCHGAHNNTGNKLLSQLTITKVCFTCHGTTGISAYRVEDEFKSRTANGSTYSFTLHKALDPNDNPDASVLNCTDCHNPHGQKIPGQGNKIYPKLLRSKNISGTSFTTADGNWFCLACHGFGDNGRFGASFWNDTAGDHTNGMTVTGNVYNAVHYDNRISVLQPASGTNVTCVKCHEKHGSKNASLLDNSQVNDEEEQCYKCHGDTTANNMESSQPTNLNIYRQFNIAPAPAAPTLTTATTGGSLLGNTTYYFKVTAYSSTADWESLPSAEAAITVPAGTNTNKVTVTIPQYTGAMGFDKFKIYMSYRGTAPAPTLSAVAATAPRDFTWNLTTGTYYVKVTANGRFGETWPSPEVSQVLASNQNLKITLPNYPNLAGYPSADFYKIYISKTAGGETYQASAPNNTAKTQIDALKTGGETPPNFLGTNDNETYQGAGTANLNGSTVYNQTAVPLTQYPVPKGSQHEVKINHADRTGAKIECTSCHGPHNVANVKYSANQSVSAVSDPRNTKKYWVQSGTSDATKTVGTMSDWCLTCHSGAGNLAQSKSATGLVPYTMVWPNLDFTNNSSGWFKDTVWPTSVHKVNGYYCTTCHDPHGTREHLILKKPYDGFDYDGNCLRCHNGSTPPAKNIKAEFQKAARHPSLDPGFGDHEIDENYNGMGDAPTKNRHAKCEDCHDPHSADGTTTTAPNPPGAIKNVTGVGFVSNLPADRPAWTSLPETSTNYVFKRPLQYEYELCYKCHSSYAFGTTLHFSTSGAMETDIAMQFNPNNPSIHPVEAQGKNVMTGLSGNWVAPWNPTSRLYCFDCHGDNLKNADNTTNTNLIRGPHGSINKYLLKAPYEAKEFSPTGKPRNDLCLLCHNAAVYDASGSGSANTTAFSQGTTNLHLDHKNNLYLDFGGANEWFCGDCHGLYVHGQKRPKLIAYQTDPKPYGDWAAIKAWNNPGKGNYQESSCSTVVKPGTNTNCYNGHNGTSNPVP